MPNGDTQDTKETTYAHKAVVERLRAHRDMIATLPTEKQLDVYSIAFDRFAFPLYKKLGLKDKALEEAKDRWIVGVLGGQGQKPLTDKLNTDIPKHGVGTEASAELVGVGAGALGGVKNFLDWMTTHHLGHASGDPQKDPVRTLLSKGESKGYELAHSVDPSAAEFGAGVGHAVPAIAAFEGAAGLVPKAAKTAPLAWRALSYLGKTAAGTAAMSTTEEKPTAKKVIEQTGVNIAFDALLRGFGKAGATGVSKIISKVKSSGTPEQQVAAHAMDDLLTTILKEKHPGKSVDQLKPEEFDAAVKEVSNRRSQIENAAKEAQKAVKEAKAAVKPSKEQQVLDKARLAEAKKAETKASNEKAKAFHKRLVDYKKRTGALPPEGHEHLEQLKSGKTVDEILGPPPEVQATQAATGVADAHKTQAIQEGAPQTIQAVEAVQSVGSKIAESAEKTKKEPMFKMDIDAILKAESPQDFAKSKKEAMEDIVRQAREKAKTAPESEKLKIVSEANKARERIRSLEVPKTFGKKTLDAARKAQEAKGTAGSVPIEEVASTKSTVTSSADPEVEMLRQEQLIDQLEDVGSENAVSRVQQAIKGKDIKLQNDMIESAIEALTKLKKATK